MNEVVFCHLEELQEKIKVPTVVHDLLVPVHVAEEDQESLVARGRQKVLYK